MCRKHEKALTHAQTASDNDVRLWLPRLKLSFSFRYAFDAVIRISMADELMSSEFRIQAICCFFSLLPSHAFNLACNSLMSSLKQFSRPLNEDVANVQCTLHPNGCVLRTTTHHRKCQTLRTMPGLCKFERTTCNPFARNN